ncbi:MAG: biopolymer transporter ExbD [Planctomycetes bacterium]|nr:biopolymer transporter ExbD [Planctomycetota bacterium]
MNDTTQALRFGGGPPKAEATIQMAPMIDIVFLLICFYLLVAQLITAQSDPAVQLPTMTSPLAALEQPAELVVNLRDDGTVLVSNQPLDAAGLRAVLSASVAEADPSLRVVIRADRRQEYRRLHAVMAICRELNIRQVILRAQGGER